MGKRKTVIIGDEENNEGIDTEKNVEVSENKIPEIADVTPGNAETGDNIESDKIEIIEKLSTMRIIKRYEFPAAPMGKCQTNIYLAGKYWKLVIIDKIYTPDEEIMKHYDELNQYLLRNDFIECSQAVQVGEIEEKVKKIKRVYKVGHPENTPHLRKNGKVSLEVDGQIFDLACTNGVIRTEKKKIYDMLIKQGWYEAGIEEMEVK